LHTWMLARWFLVYALRGSGRLGSHKSGRVPQQKRRRHECAGISGILDPLNGLSSPFTRIRGEFSSFRNVDGGPAYEGHRIPLRDLPHASPSVFNSYRSLTAPSRLLRALPCTRLGGRLVNHRTHGRRQSLKLAQESYS
jgi:hypothetical protein